MPLYTRLLHSKLFRSGLWYLVGTLGQRGLAFIGVFVFTRLMTPEEYGTVAIFMSWVAIFAATVTLNAHGAITPAKHEFDDVMFGRLASSAIALGTIGCLLAISVIMLVPDTAVQSVFNLRKLYVLLALAVVIGDLWMSGTQSVWQVEFRSREYALAGTIQGIAKLLVPVVLILAVVGPDAAWSRIVGTAAASLILGGFFLRILLRRSTTIYNRQFWRYALVFGLPLIPHTLSGFILSHFDRIMIDRFVGRDEAGLYTFAYQIGEITAMLWYASNTAWVPWFYEQMSNQNHNLIRRRAMQYTVMFAGLTIAALIVGPLIITVLGSPEYQVSRRLVPVIMASQFFVLLYSLYANIEFYEKKTGYISIATALAATVNVILNLWWLPIYGYPAAAWSTLVSYGLLFAFHAWIVRYRLKSELRLNFALLTGLSVVITLIAVVLESAYSP